MIPRARKRLACSVLARAFGTTDVLVDEMLRMKRDGKDTGAPNKKIDVIAHRGSSGKIPAHTLPAYEEAIKSGCDWVEFDCHCSKDGQLVIMHDVDLSHTTNVQDLFPSREREIFAPCVDGESERMHDWFVEDFTLEELKKLSVHHQFTTRRHRAAAAFSDRGVDVSETRFKIPTVVEAATSIRQFCSGMKELDTSPSTEHTFTLPYATKVSDEIERRYLESTRKKENAPSVFSVAVKPGTSPTHEIDLSNMVQRNMSSGFERKIFRHDDGRWTFYADENPSVGLYIETKRPGLHLEERLVADIETSGFEGPVIVQSFERKSLETFKAIKPDWKRVQLLLGAGASRNDRDHVNCVPEHASDADHARLKEFLQDIRTYADGIGPHKSSIIPNPKSPPERTSALVEVAHALGLFVHPYTFRSDVDFLPSVYHGNAAFEFMRFFDLGVDGVFCDYPSHGVFARQIHRRVAGAH